MENCTCTHDLEKNPQHNKHLAYAHRLSLQMWKVDCEVNINFSSHDTIRTSFMAVLLTKKVVEPPLS